MKQLEPVYCMKSSQPVTGLWNRGPLKILNQWCRNWGGRGATGHQYLADQLTKFQRGRADYPHLILLAPPMFFTFGINVNGIKLILDGQGNHLDSYTISLESFRSFRGTLFGTPVTGQELFFAISYGKPALCTPLSSWPELYNIKMFLQKTKPPHCDLETLHTRYRNGVNLYLSYCLWSSSVCTKNAVQKVV